MNNITINLKTLAIAGLVLLSCTVLLCATVGGTVWFVLTRTATDNGNNGSVPADTLAAEAAASIGATMGGHDEYALRFGTMFKAAGAHVELDMQRSGGIDTTEEASKLVEALAIYGVMNVQGKTFPQMDSFVERHLVNPYISKEPRKMSNDEVRALATQLGKIGDAYLTAYGE